ncbi:amino acid/amide ABC transporter ATP-binding protein 2, HAAT family [Desulfofundulus australicus DSM 11792]|uniref:Amino acid/amide ABC transporter ATP-binding protein 2, HAAT family n=1 Tax=Desulfofundulus australicus DSM 11792 TaxID=1121425 RepID=A0A1M5C5G2_9FIRM|nr:ABC transporter ATP-binding protein [Desulfofundulus australicus]SHF49955.1 amino acid/amide ABC transporter ATP-binding protein 2, HAAT family [Desulfofundulus australicus DSM 11792]
MILQVKDLEVYYGSIRALQGISFHVSKGEIVTLIGANGAGKSTTLRTISGLLTPRQGEIYFQGQKINRIPAHQIVKMGISHVPEGRQIFPNLTVMENLLMGAYTRRNRSEIQETLEEVFTRFPRLKERARQLAGTLSGGEQQMLAMGRGLMSKPTLLILDEPSMGLSPLLVEEIFEIIKNINQQGTTILLVEQNAYMALQIAHRAYVLETGRIVLSGTSNEVQSNPQIRSAYLGEIEKED